jgi:hydrogenase maturation protease
VGASNGRRIAVVGLGNVLTGDDAFGPTVIAHLEARFRESAGLEFVDAGTAGMDLASLLARFDAVVIVDTVSGVESPGAVRTWDREQLLRRPLAPRTNPHAPGLSETLWSLDLLGIGPTAVRLVGVVPSQVEVGTPLSPEVYRAVPAVVERVRTTLEEWGASLEPLDAPSAPDLWWQRSPALAPAQRAGQPLGEV